MDKNRRKFIKNLSVAIAASTYFKFAGFPYAATPTEVMSLGLAGLARANGQEFGCCIKPEHVYEDHGYRKAVQRECSIITAEAHMKWSLINPSQGEYIFSKADKIIDFAHNNGIKTRFHTLIWHRSMPQWLTKELRNGEDGEKIIRNYADIVLTRYRGKMRSWDIVNEPIIAEDNNPKGLRSTPWYAALGPDYVAKCFRIAKEYELGGDLVLNETWLSTDHESSRLQRNYLLDLVRDLKSRDVPIDAVGLQSHLKAHIPLANPDEYMKWLEQLKETGVKIFITELDVNDRKVRGSPVVRAKSNAKYVSEYLERIYTVTTPEEILMWGIYDKYNSLNNWNVPIGAQVSKSTLYGDNGQKNPLYDVMSDFLTR